MNMYSLLHSKGMYEGQRRTSHSKRVVNLTRSSYAGQSRYATFTWNGDVCATWETLRRSVAEGLNFCATGEPYWTVDVGGFFVDYREDLWFWRGDYREGTRGLTDMNALEPDPNDTGCKDLGFFELYTRWLQYAVFLPMLRSHGTDAAREIWRFGEEGSPFYDAIAASIRLRYRLIPYIYSMAAAVTFEGRSMLQPLALQFPEDRDTYEVSDQFMFGAALMVCPVLQPMLFGPESVPLQGARQSRTVYLPKGQDWYHFPTGALHRGGETIEADAPLDFIPVFARAGSIVPMTSVMQYVDEVPDAPYEVRVYTGADAAFVLYEDAGDGYGYERGECSRVVLSWDEGSRELTLSRREGEFPGMVDERDIRAVIYGSGTHQVYAFRYSGEEVRLRIEFEGKPS